MMFYHTYLLVVKEVPELVFSKVMEVEVSDAEAGFSLDIFEC